MSKKSKQKIFMLVSKIPRGKVTSYKELARKSGTHPRAVARILAGNPFPIKIPCHKVVHVDGRLGGYTPSGQAKKMQLLKREGIEIKKGKISEEYFYYFR